MNLLTIKIIRLVVNFSGDFGLSELDYYHYLSYGGNHKVEGTNDAHDFQETLKGKKHVAAHPECLVQVTKGVWDINTYIVTGPHPLQGQGFLFLPLHPLKVWGLPGLPSSGCWGLLP